MIGLREALPRVRELQGSVLVVKAGGDLLGKDSWRDALAADVAALARLGIRVVLVHGGGPQLDAVAEQLNLPTERVAGRRITSKALLDAAIMEWRGRLSAQWVNAVQRQGERAIGLAGYDGQLLVATRRPPAEVTTDDGDTVVVDFGEVGDVTGVHAAVLEALLPHGVPVVSPLAAGPDGTVLNVNADTVAAELAVALGARALVLLTRAPGILTDPSDATSVLARVDVATTHTLEAEGALQGGMRPKVAAIRRALSGGVQQAHVVDGRVPGVLLDELLTHEGHGTLVVP